MNISHLLRTRELFAGELDGLASNSLFISLCREFSPTHVYSQGRKSSDIFYVLQFMQHRVSSLATLMARLQWMAQQWSEGNHIDRMWTDYAGLDIEQWHVGFRSILDEVGLAIKVLADNKYGQPRESFNKIFKLVQKIQCDPAGHRSEAERLGSDWIDLIKTATWFPVSRAVRNEVVHFGGQEMVIGNPGEGILFQVHTGGTGKNLIRLPSPFMLNANVVYFDRYAADLMAHLLSFLEDFALIAYKRTCKTPRARNGVTIYSLGFRTLIGWIDSTMAVLSAARDDS